MKIARGSMNRWTRSRTIFSACFSVIPLLMIPSVIPVLCRIRITSVTSSYAVSSRNLVSW